MAEMNDVSPESGSNMNHKEDNALTQDVDDSNDVKPGMDVQNAEDGSPEVGDEKQQGDKESLKNSDINSENNNINNDNTNIISNVSDMKTLLEDTQSAKVIVEEVDGDLSYLYDTIGNNNKSGKKSPLFQDDDWENRVKKLREEISETMQQHTIWQNNFSARRDGAIERWKEIKRKKQQQIQKLNNHVNGNVEEDTDATEGIVTDQIKVE